MLTAKVINYRNYILTSLAFLLIITSAFSFVSCRKKKTADQSQADHPVPSVPVDLLIYTNDPLNFKLQGIGGWMYFNGGLNGIIIYRKSQQEFVALERTSTALPDNAAAKVKVLNDGFTCQDTISGSKWQIIDGVVIQGPATWPLRVYGSSFDGSILRVRN